MARIILVVLSVVLVVLLFMTVLTADLTVYDFRVQQAAIAAWVIISGWFVTFFFREVSLLIDRAERSRDLQMALAAEIFDFCETLKVEDQKALEAELTAKLARKTSKYQPFIGKISEPTIFPIVAQDIRYLPLDATDLVVQYYRTIDDLRTLVSEFSDANFRALPADRRLAVYLDMIQMRLLACDIGKLAIDELERGIKGPVRLQWEAFVTLLIRSKVQSHG